MAPPEGKPALDVPTLSKIQGNGEAVNTTIYVELNDVRDARRTNQGCSCRTAAQPKSALWPSMRVKGVYLQAPRCSHRRRGEGLARKHLKLLLLAYLCVREALKILRFPGLNVYRPAHKIHEQSRTCRHCVQTNLVHRSRSSTQTAAAQFRPVPPRPSAYISRLRRTPGRNSWISSRRRSRQSWSQRCNGRPSCRRGQRARWHGS